MQQGAVLIRNSEFGIRNELNLYYAVRNAAAVSGFLSP